MSTPTAEAAAPDQAPPAASVPPAPLASRLVDIFFAPSKVFEQFREGPAPWLGPTLVCVAATLVMIALTPLFISNRQAAEFALQKMSEMGTNPNLPSVEEMAARMPLQYAIGAVAASIGIFLRVWIMALVLWGVSAVLLGGRAPLRAHAAVASHAFVVSTAGEVLVGLLRFATHRLDLTLDAALLAPGVESGSVAASLLHAITPWGLWLVVLLALGAAVVNRRKSWAGVAVVLLTLQLALVVAGSLFMHMLKGRAAGGG
jgi:hypothetical protein